MNLLDKFKAWNFHNDVGEWAAPIFMVIAGLVILVALLIFVLIPVFRGIFTGLEEQNYVKVAAYGILLLCVIEFGKATK